jgi:hypothetical protein
VQYTFAEQTSGSDRRIVFEEELDASGTPQLVATQIDGEFTAAEVEHAYGQALAWWLHPIEVPTDWLE